jgi:outer membrane protein OmpA-like peptidoglycan-associated protein
MKSNGVKFGIVSVAFIAIGSINPSLSQKSSLREIFRQGFESTVDKEKPAELGSIELVENGVNSPTETKADLFSKSGSGDVLVPGNAMGVEEAIKDVGGENYAGVYFYKPGKASKERTYITIPIMKGKEPQTLKKGLTYCVEFSVSLSESSKFAVNNIAAHFSKESLTSDGVGYIIKSEKVMKGQGNKIYTGFYGWEKVCNIYTAKGDEKFITIGNFDGNEQTQFTQVKKPKDSQVDQLPHAYYYVDNVIISLVTKPEDCPCYNANPQKVEETYSTLIYTNNPEVTEKMSLSDKIGLYDVYFRFGKASFTDNAKEMMNLVVEEMKANPSIRLEVQGNRDATEGKAAEANPDFEDMDRKRTSAVVKYFVSQGIDATRLVERNNGADVANPKIDNVNDDQEIQDAKNRRVSFKVLK